MAYISAIDDEEEKPAAGGMVAPPPAGGAAPAAAAPQQPAASKFVGFSQYLNANREAAANTARSVSGGINTQGQAVQNDLAGAQTQFNNNVKTGSNPVTGYTGPNALADNSQWAGMQDRARKAQDAAAATASSGGIGAMLQEQNPGAYSAGNRRMDTALAGYVGADDFAKARERYGKLSDTLNQANDVSVKTADAARTTTNDAKTAADTAAAAAQTRVENAQIAADKNAEHSFWASSTDPLVATFGWDPKTVTGIRRGDTPTGEQMLDIVMGPKDFTGTRNSPIAKFLSGGGKSNFVNTWDSMSTGDKRRAAAFRNAQAFMDFMAEMSAKYGQYQRPDGKVSVIGQRGPTGKVSIIGQGR